MSQQNVSTARNKRFILLVLLVLFSGISLPLMADTAKLTSQLQTMLDASLSDYSTPGVVLLVSSPKIGTLSVASGYANKKTATVMKVDNNFRIASMSKTFLAVAILKLSEEGKLNLDDKISELLPDTIDIQRIPNGNKVTVRQLLAMRSGIPNYMESDGYSALVENQPNHKWIPEDCIKMIYDADPTFKPGTSYEYSNTNYSILQLILETLTGNNYAVALRKYIFNPTHMKNTYVEVNEERTGGFNGLNTHGYDTENEKIQDVTELNDGLGLGDGGIISTAEDMKLFVQALLENKTLLPNNLLLEMQQVKGKDQYGLGIYKEEVSDASPWTHNGSASGFSGQFYYFPNEKLTIIILTNISGSGIYDDAAPKAFDIITKQ